MTSSVGILNQSHDNLEKRIARIESQLGRPRSCKYGTTAERTAYGAPVEGVLWWDTTEEVLYVWYNYNWILAKGVMVGGTTEREATSLPTAGGMWWDTDEDNLYVWGISNSWQSVTGAKFGTREQRDAGGFGGCVWICSDEGYAYAYDDTIDKWRGIGDSVFDLNWLYQRGGDFAIMGHRTLAYDYYLSEQKDIHKIGSSGGYLTETGPVKYGQDGLVPYADFSDGVTQAEGSSVICELSPAGLMEHTTPDAYTIMIWFKINEYDVNYVQPIIGSGSVDYWRLYISNTNLKWNGAEDGFLVSLDAWHFAAVRNGYFRLDDGDWSQDHAPIRYNGYPPVDYGPYDRPGTISYYNWWRAASFDYWQAHLHGRVSMYYVHGSIGLTEGQIDMFYERTRRLHGV